MVTASTSPINICSHVVNHLRIRFAKVIETTIHPSVSWAVYADRRLSFLFLSVRMVGLVPRDKGAFHTVKIECTCAPKLLWHVFGSEPVTRILLA